MPETEMMMLKAAVEPMMIRARMQVEAKVTQTAFAGTPEPGRTRERKLWKGRPLSRAKLARVGGQYGVCSCGE